MSKLTVLLSLNSLLRRRPYQSPCRRLDPSVIFVTDLNSICDQTPAAQQPIFMTKNGKISLAAIDRQAYERERQHERMVHKIREAKIESRYIKETVSQEQLDDKMGEIFSIRGPK